MNPATVSALIASLFPPGAEAAEVRTVVDPAILFDEELRAVAGSAPKRISDFAAGRACARKALERLGISEHPLGVNANRTPRWPAAIVGSITHTVGFCGAVAGPRERFDALGLDAERLDGITRDVWAQILTPAELGGLDALPISERAVAAALAFSAKEAFYKAQFGITGSWLGFEDVEIDALAASRTHGEFRVRIVAPVRFRALAGRAVGRYRFESAVVVAGVAFVAVSGGDSR